MSDFGTCLRTLRLARGWRQQDLVEALEGGIARSTLANVESGREPPTPRLWLLLETHLPDWTPSLTECYRAAREAVDRSRRDAHPSGESPGGGHVLGGPFVVEQFQLALVFRHSRSPEEVIEVRRVRATRSGADAYGLKFERVHQEGFRAETEALWGGSLESDEVVDVDGRTLHLRRVRFSRTLRRGQTHEFALRSWVQQDPEPGTYVNVAFPIPASAVALHLNFLGPEKPHECWHYGPLADEALLPEQAPLDTLLTPSPGGTVSHHLTGLEPGASYGIAWRW